MRCADAVGVVAHQAYGDDASNEMARPRTRTSAPSGLEAVAAAAVGKARHLRKPGSPASAHVLFIPLSCRLTNAPGSHCRGRRSMSFRLRFTAAVRRT